MKKKLFLLALGGLLFASGTMAQMRPGAAVEKTYGLGLPRDMDKLIPLASEYEKLGLEVTTYPIDETVPTPREGITLGGPPNGTSFGTPGRAGGE